MKSAYTYKEFEHDEDKVVREEYKESELDDDETDEDGETEFDIW